MLTAPRTDPYAKYYLIRLLLLVERENDLSDTDEESWAAVSSDQRAVVFVPKAMLPGPSDCDDAVDGARAW